MRVSWLKEESGWERVFYWRSVEGWCFERIGIWFKDIIMDLKFYGDFVR